MRILHWIGRRRLPKDPAAGSTGGISRVALELAQAQRRLGQETWVAATGPAPWEGEWRGVRLLTLPEAAWIPSLRLSGAMSNLRTHAALVACCRRSRFDVVHGHEDTDLRLVPARLRVCHIHNNPFWSEHDPRQWRSQAAQFRALQHNSDLRVGVSGFVATQLRKGAIQILGLSPDSDSLSRICVVRNGVDPGRFSEGKSAVWRIEQRRAWGIANDDVVFLYAGAVAKDKGVLHLAHAFRQLAVLQPRVRLVVAGAAALWGGNFNTAGRAEDIPYEAEVREVLRAPTEKGQVRWLGVVGANEIPAVYAGADVVVIPSICEAFSLVAVEAMASARPVIASAVEGIPETLAGSDPLLVPAGDARMLEDAMIRLVRDPELRQRSGELGLKAAQTLTWDKSATELELIYKTTIAA